VAACPAPPHSHDANPSLGAGFNGLTGTKKSAFARVSHANPAAPPTKDRMVALPSAPRKFQELRMKLQRWEAVHPERLKKEESEQNTGSCGSPQAGGTRNILGTFAPEFC
jgi:hypothetical protein